MKRVNGHSPRQIPIEQGCVAKTEGRHSVIYIVHQCRPPPPPFLNQSDPPLSYLVSNSFQTRAVTFAVSLNSDFLCRSRCKELYVISGILFCAARSIQELLELLAFRCQNTNITLCIRLNTCQRLQLKVSIQPNN